MILKHKTHEQYIGIMRKADRSEEMWDVLRVMCEEDLYFLLVYILGRADAMDPWV